MTEKITDLTNDLKSRGHIPHHVAIIMDGNGRWAQKRGLPRAAGHKKGVETVRRMVEICVELGVKYLTLYTFSTENWKRPKDEVSTLMRLIVKSLKNETNDLHKNNVKLSTIGDNSLLPKIVQKELDSALEKTRNNSGLQLNLALSYSGRWEIINAVKSISELICSGKLKPEEIDEELFSNHLSTNSIPDPDLLIRSGGDLRISNFLLWQIAYAEIYVTPVLWPDFEKIDFLNSIKDFQSRERRFGLVSEQLSNREEEE